MCSSRCDTRRLSLPEERDSEIGFLPTIFLRAQPCLGFYFYILMISFNVNCTAILYYSEKHSSSALTNSKHVDAVFLNKFAVKGSANSVVVHILWKCLFKLMQYSMVYPERFK